MQISDLIKTTLEELQDLMVSRTVVGEAIPAGEHTVIPVSQVMFGFGGGGGNDSGASATKSTEGRGIGGGWSIKPVAFVVVGPDGAKLLTIGEKESAVTKLIDLAPKVVETVKDFVSTRKEKGEPSDSDQSNLESKSSKEDQ
ncbi:MAG: GerW family sporulation protein [Fidelibacterota bacterium]